MRCAISIFSSSMFSLYASSSTRNYKSLESEKVTEVAWFVRIHRCICGWYEFVVFGENYSLFHFSRTYRSALVSSGIWNFVNVECYMQKRSDELCAFESVRAKLSHNDRRQRRDLLCWIFRRYEHDSVLPTHSPARHHTMQFNQLAGKY